MQNPLKWHGGKGAFNGKLARWIISALPKDNFITYVEPFFGGGSVLLAKDKHGHSEIVNDVHKELSNFWQVLAEEPEELIKSLSLTPFSEDSWKRAKNSRPRNRVKRAANFFILCRQSRQGLCKDFATMSKTRTRRGMNEQVASWLSSVDGLYDVYERIKKVVILNRDAIKVIEQLDDPLTCFYLDPPYLHSTRSTKKDYKHEMSEKDHIKLLETISKIKGKFLLSGYYSDLYNKYAKKNSWNTHTFLIANNASSLNLKNTKTEYLWTNY